MMKHDLLAKLGDLAGERDLFTDLRFGVRKLSRPVAVMAESLAPLESEVGEEPVLDLPKEEFKADSIRDIAKKRLAKWNDAT